MTLQEQKTIDSLNKSINQLREDNLKFKDDITQLIKVINKKVDEKREPLSLEKEVIYSLNDSLKIAFQKALSDSYNSPLKKYADNIVIKHQVAIEKIFDTIVTEGISTYEFKESVRITFLNKLSKTVVSGIDGSLEKTINLMKQDSIFRSRLTLAVNTLVEEFINQPKA